MTYMVLLFIFTVDGRLVLIGVVGRGIGCARFNEPGKKSINHVFYPMIYSTTSYKKLLSASGQPRYRGPESRTDLRLS